MSYYRRGYNWEQVEYLPAPTGGWNPDSNPWEMPSTEAPALDNAVIRPGKISVRGSINNYANLSGVVSPAPPLNVCGVQQIPGGTQLLLGRKAVSSTAYVDPWFAPQVRPAAAAALAAPDANAITVNSGTSFVSAAAGGANFVVGPRAANFAGSRYYISYGTATAPITDVSGTYYAQTTNLNILSQNGSIAICTNAPRGALDVKGYQQRLWLLGGIDDPASATHFNPLTLFFSNVNTSPTAGFGNTAAYADWKDSITGNTNYITMDGDYLDPGVGLATVRNGLIIFRYQSVWLLRGSTTANYALVPVSRDVGCIDPRSIVETDHGVYFISHQGLMFTNGTTVSNMSGSVLHTLQNAIQVVYGSIKSGYGGYITCANTNEGQIIVSMGVAASASSAPTGSLQPVWCGMYDPSVKGGAWTRITSALFSDGTIITPNNTYPGWVFRTPDRRFLSIGDSNLYLWEQESAGGGVASVPTAPSNPSTSTNDASVGSVAWQTPNNINSGVGVAVAALPSAGNQSELLKGTNYGFSIPAAASVVGIQVAVKRIMANGVGTNAGDTNVQVYKAGALQAANRSTGAVIPASPSVAVFGGPTDLWGTTWAPADINNAGFGAAYACNNIGSTATTVDVYYMQITVYYQLANVVLGQSFVKNPALYDFDGSTTYHAIPFVWKTRFVPVVGTTTLTRKFGQIKRYFFDYVLQGVGLPSAAGFTVTPVTASGAVVTGTAPLSVPSTNNSLASSSVSGGTPDASTAIQRVNQDWSSEVSDVAFSISYTDANRTSQPSYVAADLHGIGIEYQPTRDLR